MSSIRITAGPLAAQKSQAATCHPRRHTSACWCLQTPAGLVQLGWPMGTSHRTIMDFFECWGIDDYPSMWDNHVCMFIYIYIYIYIYMYIHTYISRYSSFWRTCAANNPVLPHVRHIRLDPRASSPKLRVKWDLQISPFIQLHPASNYMVTYMALKKWPRQNFRNQKIIGNELLIVVTQWWDPFTSIDSVSPVHEDSHRWAPQTYAMPPPTPRPRSANADFPIRNWGDVQKQSKMLEFTKESGVDQSSLLVFPGSWYVVIVPLWTSVKMGKYLGIPEM